jgi:glycosyltransferase involved in cell wall biosynthesis
MIYSLKEALDAQRGEAAHMKLSRHYLETQLYRFRIVGLPFLKDVLRVELRRKRQEAKAAPIHTLGDPDAWLRLLYVHQGWSTYNVGLLWFSNLPGVRCTFIDVNDLTQHPELGKDCNVILFAYSQFLRMARGMDLQKPKWLIVHDPFELYSEAADWKTRNPLPEKVALFMGADAVFAVSKEMQSHLAKAGIASQVIPTTSILPARSPETLCMQNRPARVLTVGRVYPRKNFELFKEIKRVSARRFPGAYQFSAKWDYEPLSEEKYIERLDASDIYIVTSHQEGGPIPAMDAMTRGEIVLSTPVGQMTEIIQDGHNGFLCATRDEFLARLKELADDPHRLLAMRRNALQSIQSLRARETIADAVEKAIANWRPRLEANCSRA